MDRETIRVGDQYGYRKYPQRRGTPLERIEVLEKVRPGKWKVRFLDDPYPGLIDYVRSGNLLVSWSEQEAFLDDERRLLKILEASATQWSGQLDDPVAGAINSTLNATGEGDTFLYDYGGRDFGHAELPLDVAKRILMRTDLDWDPLVLDPLGFVDRHGKLHLPFQGALKLA
ncbi:MAG TPA: hypothetical protein VLJ79_25615 [Candidatus Binatia bacterium]|nr:hypothetical protein [Candidatus Binatia bacterium]